MRMQLSPLILCAFALAGCGDKSDAPGSASATAKPTAKASATATVTVTATVTATATAAPFVQKGVGSSEAIVGYLQDEKDEGVCEMLTAPEATKAKMDEKTVAALAKRLKAKVVSACPTENVVGTCKVGKDMLLNYTSPKYDKDKAQKECKKMRGTWLE